MTKSEVLAHLHIRAYYEQALPSIKWNGKNGVALCPWHEDHTPSLSIDVQSGAFTCFGCDRKGSIFDYHTPDQAKLHKDIEDTKEYILLAQDVGATGVKVRPNGLPKEVPVEKTLEQIGKALREVGEFAKDHGQAIRLEVHGSGTAFPPHIKTILDVANHPNVGACWNSNKTDLDGEGWDHNFNLLKSRINAVHITDLFQEDYPYRKLFSGLNEIGYEGFCLAEIPASQDPIRVMKYYRALWLAYQGLL